MKQSSTVVLVCGLITLSGCSFWNSQPKAKPLTQQSFISPRTTVTPIDPPAVQQPDPAIAAVPAPKPPATLPVIGPSGGQFMTLGGVVAEVNGTPIHASKVLALLEVPMREKARQLDAKLYQRWVSEDIRRQIMELVRSELEYAAAQRNLDTDDRRLADAATIYWRMQQITQAGGSLELARRASLAKGVDFDEACQDQQRTEMVRIYYNKKVYPKIQVSAADIREYYDRNVDREFSENEKVSFRLIKVDIKRTGTKEKAIEKITDKYKRAKAGEDFKTIAMKENDETMFAGEAPFEVAPKSFAIVKVREALSKLNPDQISEIIEDANAFYLVKLEKRIGGKTRPFEDQKVQDEIRFKLRSDQFRALREQVQQGLMKGAIIRTDDQMAMIAVDMAMQRYSQYAAAK